MTTTKTQPYPAHQVELHELVHGRQQSTLP